MTRVDLMALMPLIILGGGSVLVLLAGGLRPGGYLYETALALTAGALVWSAALPQEAALQGVAVNAFSRTMSVFVCASGLVGLLLAMGYNRRRGIVGEEYPATLLFALAGMWAVCASADLLMLFLGLEAFTFAFYILVAIKRGASRGGEAGLKYLLNGTLSAAVLAMGIALIYAATGTFSLKALPAIPSALPDGPLYQAGVALLIIGLAFKLSLAPAHLWTPDVYQGAPAPVTALLSTASKGVSIVAVLLVMPLAGRWAGTHDLFWGLALMSVICGNLAALLQGSIKRMLAWSSVAQMGYVALGFTAVSSGGGQAALFYAVAYAAAGLASFGAVAALSGTGERDRLEDYRGLGYRHPLAGAALAVSMFSLAGIPPTAGFMGKFAVFSAALRGGDYGLAVVAILTAVVAVYYYLRVVVMLYMQPEGKAGGAEMALTSAEAVALSVTTLVTIWLGLFPGQLLDLLGRLLSIR